MATAPDERSLDTKNATMVMAMAGRSARACDVCGRERARWYCGADDAYLCGRCDTSVHCVNALASRHERVRLGPNGVPAKGGSDRSDCLPSSKSLSGVHSKKATKGGKHHAQSKLRTTKDDMLTPTFFSYHEDTRVPGYIESLPEDQGTQHVPEFQGSIEGFESSTGYGYVGLNVDQGIPALERGGEVCVDTSDEDEYLDFTDIVTEADFIGDNGDEGLVFNQDNVKAESIDQFQPAVVEGVECDQLTSVKLEKTSSILSEEVEGKRNLPPLKLDYEEILSAWSGRAPFWTGSDGQPQTVPVFPNMDIVLNLDLENFHRETVGEVPVLTMGEASMGEEASEAGGGREARVMRYREKRRTRLFSKQIRYEVRKLNAERRPRMKGRFVKRLPT